MSLFTKPPTAQEIAAEVVQQLLASGVAVVVQRARVQRSQATARERPDKDAPPTEYEKSEARSRNKERHRWERQAKLNREYVRGNNLPRRKMHEGDL